jgi:uncharacterized protein YndB with AHSA1/START domain
MPRTSRQATLAAPPEQVFRLISDPDHLARWWPGVNRVEAVVDDRFTLVMPTRKGRPMRVDFRTLTSEPPHRHAWAQEVVGTPFERVLAEHVTTIELHGHADHTHVTIEARQRLRGYALLGSWMLRRVNRARLESALASLVQIFGDGSH